MPNLSQYALIAGLMMVALAVGCYILALTLGRSVPRAPEMAHACAYLHSRVARGWVGRRAAWLLVAGFASVLLTFFGNLFFGGLHSYAK